MSSGRKNSKSDGKWGKGQAQQSLGEARSDGIYVAGTMWVSLSRALPDLMVCVCFVVSIFGECASTLFAFVSFTKYRGS